MMKLNWTQPKEYKIFFPIFNTHFVKFLLLQNEFVFLLVDFDILIYKFNGEAILFETKKSINFISTNEQITWVGKNNSINNNNFILISTNSGNIYILNFNLTDYFFEIYYHLNIRHNFIHEYEILFYDDKNILLTIDKHLFQCEIVKNSSKKTNVIKNLLLRMVDENEKVISSYIKHKSYVIIFTNKAIYNINFEGDGTTEIIYKKEENYFKFNFSGFVMNDVIYYVKDFNSFSIYHIYDKNNKFTVKLSAKNLLNDLNFYQVVNVTEKNQSTMITIANEKNTELYFINDKYKLFHRESILFNGFFLFLKSSILVIGFNLLNLNIKYKIGNINPNVVASNNQPSEVKDKFELDLNLSMIEDYFLNNKLSKLRLTNRIKGILKNINKIFSIWLISNQDLTYVSDKIKKKIIKIYSICPSSLTFFRYLNKIHLKFHSIFIYKYGSYSMKKSFKILFVKYFTNLYEDKIKYLLKISYMIKDVEVIDDLLKVIRLF